jgi:glycosyltransferase involved in cell wall biosynthesis
MFMSTLKQANEALRSNKYEAAIRLYVQALEENPIFAHAIQPNLKIAQTRYLKARSTALQLRVLVSGWNLALNAAGRAATLAQLYQPLAEVGIIGCTFDKWGHDSWIPIRNLGIPIQSIQIKDESQFINQALALVRQNPCDLLHLSKPRMPNIIIGALYKKIWGSRVILDIDDEELAFVGASSPLPIADYLKTNANLPELRDLPGETWTRLAVGLTNSFDGITVVNPALQQRYGGELVRHARDEKQFAPSAKRRQKSRNKLGLPQEEKVVLFLGTPRQHKGLLETAQAIASLRRNDVRYLIVGDFSKPNEALKADIEAIPGLKTQFLSDQPFETIPDILAAADVCVLLQDPQSTAAQYQTPAKITDALAMGLPVLAEKTPGLADLAEKGAFQVVNRRQLAKALDHVLKQPSHALQAHPVFLEMLTLADNRSALAEHIKSAKTQATLVQAPLQTLFNLLPLPKGLQPSYDLTKPIATESKRTKVQTKALQSASLPVDVIIRAAKHAMTQDDWSGAYEHWKSLLSRPQGELSIDHLLRISRELFKLDAFTEAATALKKAASLNQDHPGVLCEQAQQYYYHCYSSWLMLVTENEPDWYKADGLEIRPDWQTACELIEKAEKASPRNNLRRYVQAYLLLAEEAWGKQNRKEAHAALGTALKAIGPNKLDTALTQAIYTAVDKFRDGQVNEQDPYFQKIQDQIKALPLNLLIVPDWLCLNDILNWNGLLLCGYVAREKAVDLALAHGKVQGASRESLKTALKAALDRNDTALADDFLGKLKQISSNAIDVRELESCCDLMKGNLEAFRQKWPHSPTPAEKRLRDYLKGKTVAVVGPAPTGTLDGEEIDSFDVVVRMNWRGLNSRPNAREFGSRTEVSLYNAHTVRYLKEKNLFSATHGIPVKLVRRSRHDCNGLHETCCVLKILNEYPGVFYKSLNAAPSILFELFTLGLDQLHLFKTTFYTGKLVHARNYRSASGLNTADNSSNFKSILANHDFICQLSFVRALLNNKLLIAKKEISNIACSNLDYLANIQLSFMR